MTSHSQRFVESAFINILPLFAGENYPCWKIKVKNFLEFMIRGFGM